MRLLILPCSARNWLVACLFLCAVLVVGLRVETQSRPLLLQFVPPEDQETFFAPQVDPSITSEEAVSKALEFHPAADAAVVREVVLVHLSDVVDPPLDDALAWAVNFDPQQLTERLDDYPSDGPEFHPIIFTYVLIDAHTGEPLFSAEGGGAPIGHW
jgi:hypothetical protein